MVKYSDYIWEEIIYWHKRGESLDSLAKKYPPKREVIRMFLVNKGFSFKKETSLDLLQRQKVLKDHESGYSFKENAKRNNTTVAIVTRFLKKHGKTRKLVEIPEEAFKRYINGENANALAKEYGFNRVTFINRLRQKGLKRKQIKVSKEEHQKIVHMYVEEELSRSEISKITGYSEMTIYDHLKKSNIKRSNQKITEEEIQQAIKLAKQGKSFVEISKEINQPANRIKHHFKKRKVYVQNRRLTTLEIMEILNLLSDGKEIQFVAKKFNRHPITISQIINGETYKNVRNLFRGTGEDFKQARRRKNISRRLAKNRKSKQNK